MKDQAAPANVGSNDGLGPLLEPAQTAYVTDSVMRSHEVRSYTASQLRAHAAAAVAAERERCAALCDGVARVMTGSQWRCFAKNLARAIREDQP